MMMMMMMILCPSIVLQVIYCDKFGGHELIYNFSFTEFLRVCASFRFNLWSTSGVNDLVGVEKLVAAKTLASPQFPFKQVLFTICRRNRVLTVFNIKLIKFF